MNKRSSAAISAVLKKTDNPKSSPVTDVLAATKAVDQALRDAEKGYHRALYEQAARVYEIAKALRTSPMEREAFAKEVGGKVPAADESVIPYISWVMRAIPALSREKASLWLRAFKSLPDEEIRAVGVAAALKKLGGFKKLADKNAAQKRAASKSNHSGRTARKSRSSTAKADRHVDIRFRGAELEPDVLEVGREVTIKGLIERLEPLEIRAPRD